MKIVRRVNKEIVLMNRLCRPWQRRYRRGSFAEQLLQPDKPFVTVCAIAREYAANTAGTNRAKPLRGAGLPVKHMLEVQDLLSSLRSNADQKFNKCENSLRSWHEEAYINREI